MSGRISSQARIGWHIIMGRGRDDDPWRSLKLFWLAILGTTLVGGGVLQWLGPLPRADSRSTSVANRRIASFATKDPEVYAMAGPQLRPHNGIADPDPALLIGYEGAELGAKLPRLGPDGRTPMAVYAAPFNVRTSQPKVSLVVAGIGLNQADSMAAIQQLPGPVTLAVSPYSGPVTSILAAARQAGHEYLLSLPMRPDGFPINDPDDRHALLTSLSPAENLVRLHWVMTRITGYVGLINIIGQMQASNLGTAPEQMDPVMQDVAERGLLFVSGTTGPAPIRYTNGRIADMVVDEPPFDASALDLRLAALDAIARDKGTALGIILLPHPVTLQRVVAWTAGLNLKGVVLAPVSALAVASRVQDGQ